MTLISLLYLEDNLLDLELVVAYLDNVDIEYNLDHAINEREMKSHLKQKKYDLLLSDYQLPDYDGISALEYVKENFSSLPVIIISGRLGEEAAIETLKKGATDYILKQNLSRLAEAIKRALREADEHSRRVAMEERLKESEIKYRKLFESSNDAVVIHHLDGQIVNMNSRAAEMFSILKEDYEKTCFYNFIEDSSPLQTIQTAGTLQFETKIKSDETSCIYVDISSNVVELDKLMVQSVVRNISEKYYYEVRQKKMIETLERKNTELERFNYTVSHDLKTPLFTIKGFLFELRKDCESLHRDRIERDLAEINQAVNHMSDLLVALMNYAKVGNKLDLYETISVVQTMHHISLLLKEKLNSKSVTITVNPDVPAIWGDKVRLVEVFLNLIENAVNFMGDQKSPEIKVDGFIKNNQTVVCIKDNGIGIDPAYSDNVFGLFNKLDNETAGTGMGLTISRQIIELHHGRIWVDSDGVGSGSTFCFALPLKDAPEKER